jgi:hypothetical protein
VTEEAMINRLLLKHRAETLAHSEVAEVLEYINIMESVKQQATSPDPLEEAILGLLLQVMREEQVEPRKLARQTHLTN